MKHMKIVLSLLVVVVVFTGFVFLVESITTPEIQLRLIQEANIAKFEVLSSLSDEYDIDSHEVPSILDEYDVTGTTILDIFYQEGHGYIYEAQFQGYQSKIRYMIGISEEGEITGFKVLEQGDTPGLGAEIANSENWEQFTGMALSKALNQEIDGLAGATVTTDAWKLSLSKVADFHVNTVLGFVYTDITSSVGVSGVTKAEEMSKDGTVLEVSYRVEFESQYSDGPNVYSVTFEIGEGIKNFEIIEATDTESFGGHIADPEFTEQFIGMDMQTALNAEYDDLGGSTYPVTLAAFAETFSDLVDFHSFEYEGVAPEFIYNDVTADVDVDSVTEAIEKTKDGNLLEVAYTVEFVAFSGEPNVYEIIFEIGVGVKSLNVTSATDTPGYGGELGSAAFMDQFLAMTLEDAFNNDYDGLAGATVTTDAFAATFTDVFNYHNDEYEQFVPEFTYNDVTGNVDVDSVTKAVEKIKDGGVVEVTYTIEFESAYSSAPNVYEVTFEVGTGIKTVVVLEANDTPGFGANIGDPLWAEQFLGMAIETALDGTYDGVAGATATTEAFVDTFDDVLTFHNIEYEGAAPETFEEMVQRYKEEVSVKNGTFVDVTGDYDLTGSYVTMLEEVTPEGETEATHLVISFTFPGLFSDIQAITGINLEDSKLNGLRIVYENETDGIGDRILEEDFLAQFDDLNILGAKYGVYDSIGGATYTTGTQLTAGFDNIITWYDEIYLGNAEEPLTEAQILQQSITNIFPTQFSINDITDNYVTTGTDVQKVLEIKDINHVILGYVFVAEGEGASYSEPTFIKYLIAIFPDQTFAGFEMLDDNETPGRADPYYLVEYATQFIGVDIEVDGYPIDEVTGSTITHNAIMDSALNIAIFFVEEVMGGAFNRPDPTSVAQGTLELAFPTATQFTSIYLDHPLNDYLINVYEARDAGNTLLGYVYIGEADGYGANPIQFAWGINVSGTTEQIEIIDYSETWSLAEDWASYDGSQGYFPSTPWLAANFEGINIANITTTETIDDVAGVSTTTSGMREAAEAIVAYHNANIGGGS